MQTLKEVKGILNKLTPEKFDTLSRQLIQLVTNSEVLQGTITLIFENAVAQPTFVALYATLCDSLAKVRPPIHIQSWLAGSRVRTSLQKHACLEYKGALNNDQTLSLCWLGARMRMLL